VKYRFAVILLLALGFLGTFPAAASADNYIAYTNVSGSCDGQNISFSGTLSYKIIAGSTIKLTLTETYQGQTQTISAEDTFPQDMSGNSPIGGTFPSDLILEETYQLYNPDGSLASSTTLHVECGNVWGSSNKGIPGCDLLPIPETAVVGSFTAAAEVSWAPGQLVAPATTITAGNTAWVLGMDASGQYYKIIWSCDHLWVPVNSMGPNFDDVWQGRPLPTEVVK
jgi:hypothetical protein